MSLDLHHSDHISSATYIDFKTLVENVLDHAPSDASCEAFLHRSEAGPYRASVHIRNMDLDIGSRRSCESPDVLLHSVKNDLFRQIRDWLARRDLNSDGSHGERDVELRV